METYALKKILVATDYTEQAGNAVHTAATLCLKHDAVLTILHVVKDATAFTPADDFNPSLDYTRDMKIAAQSELFNYAQEIRERYRVRVEEVIAYGVVVQEITRMINESDPDLVVMGTHGASGFRRFFIGSTAYRVIKHTRYPVLTVPGNGDWTTLRKVLLPVRWVPDAVMKYDVVRPILQYDRSMLHILALSLEPEYKNLMERFTLGEELEKRLREDVVVYDISYQHTPDYDDAILQTATTVNADLIVIVASIDKTKRELYIGPFSQQILNHAKVPVLCVRT
jgi:nucleotide-binding universal stress UspA family protein